MNHAFRELVYKRGEEFLRGRTPASLLSRFKNRTVPNPACAKDKELPVWLDRLPDDSEWALYWSAYRYRRRNGDGFLAKPKHSSIVIDACVGELEHQECGVLCDHTLEEAKHFAKWLVEQDMEALFLYSGGKSIHYYIPFPEAKVPDGEEHERVKALNLAVPEAAGLRLNDEVVARTGWSTIMRLPGAVNGGTGYSARLVWDGTNDGLEGFLGSSVDDLLEYCYRVGQKPKDHRLFQKRYSEIKDDATNGNGVVKELVESEGLLDSDDSKEEEGVRRATGGGSSLGNTKVGGCPTVRMVARQRPPVGERRHHMMVLIDQWMKEGYGKEEVIQKVKGWNEGNDVGLPRSEVRSNVTYRFQESDAPNKDPCAWGMAMGKRCRYCLGGNWGP